MGSRRLKIGWFINTKATFGAICAAELCGALLDCGYDAKLYAKSFDESFGDSIQSPLPDSGLECETWWLNERVDLAIFYRVDSFPTSVLRAAKRAGVVVCFECDSDGYISPKQSPIRHLRLRHDPSLELMHQLRSWKAYFDSWKRSPDLERVILGNFDMASWIKIESEEPAAILKRFLINRGRADLADKVIVIPFAVRNEFTKSEVLPCRKARVIAAGRLGAHQKNPQAMAMIAKQIGTQMPEVELELHIRGKAPMLESLSGCWPNVTVFLDSTSSFLRSRLSDARVLLSASRWETTPIQGLEALCSGCTIVAPSSVPGFVSLVGAREFGRYFGSTHSAIGTLRAELAEWESGMRNPIDIAKHWRARCSLNIVAERMISLMLPNNEST